MGLADRAYADVGCIVHAQTVNSVRHIAGIIITGREPIHNTINKVQRNSHFANCALTMALRHCDRTRRRHPPDSFVTLQPPSVPDLE